VQAELVHSVGNEDPDNELVTHTAFASDKPTREFAPREFPLVARGCGNPTETDPETILRWRSRVTYELSEGTVFNDLFARRFGAKGICGGYGHFLPGSALPCHTHDYDESITIVKGAAVCLVQGRRYELRGCDTAFVPSGIPHRFLNPFEEEMDMVWVYAGDEPGRNIVDARYCSGALRWPTERPAQ
ncbi:MAG: cupin domain-containing protein, partial [Candidatus Acidiferrales bacterium]